MKLTKRKGFNFFRSYYDVYNELENNEDKVAFIEALLDRQFLGVKPLNLKGMAKFAYISQQHSIDAQVIGFEQKTREPLTPITVCSQGGTAQGEVKGEGQEEGEVQYVSCLTFFEFWDLYDKKVGDKEKIQKKFEGLSETDKQLILDHVPKYKLSKPDKQYRKDPATYLNNKSWNDEIIMPKAGEQPQSKTDHLKTVYHNVLEKINAQPNE